MAQDWDTAWKEAKKFFVAETGRKKPDAKVNDVFLKHTAGLDKTIKACKEAHDATEVAISKSKTDAKKKPAAQAAFVDYQKKIAAFKTAKDSYILVLENAVEKELHDNAQKTVYSKGCKFLAKQLTALYEAMNARKGWLTSSFREQDANQTTAANAVSTAHSCALKCLAAAAKVKTKPTKEEFDNTLYTPARDLSQYIGNIPLLRRKGYAFSDRLDDQRLKGFYDQIRPYGDERLKRMLADNASSAQVLTLLKTFTDVVKLTDAHLTQA